VKGSTFVPIVGLFAGGAKSSGATYVFVFGSDGKLMSSSSSGVNVDCSTSIASAHCH
jgi:hypothetical protein